MGCQGLRSSRLADDQARSSAAKRAHDETVALYIHARIQQEEDHQLVHRPDRWRSFANLLAHALCASGLPIGRPSSVPHEVGSQRCTAAIDRGDDGTSCSASRARPRRRSGQRMEQVVDIYSPPGVMGLGWTW
jgi:hypothetical protein